MLIKRGKIWHTRLMFNGQLYQRSLKTRVNSTALKLEAQFRASLIRGEFGIIEARDAAAFVELEDRFLTHLKKRVGTRTYGFYAQQLKVLLRYSPIATARPHQIDTEMIDNFADWRSGQGVVPVTVNHALRTLRRLLHLAKDWKMRKDIPKINLLPGENQRDFVLTEDHVGKMIDCARKKYKRTGFHLWLPFLVDTGLRISELCALEKEHVTLTDGNPSSIRVAKGKSKYAKREIDLTPRASEAIAEGMRLSRCTFAFSAVGGKRQVSRHYASEIFRTVRDEVEIAGKECVLHSTRHTFCTRLGDRGASAFDIQVLAGHSSILISQRYVHTERSRRSDAIKLLINPVE